MTTELRLALLGGLQIFQGDAPVEDPPPAKAQALLCYLAITGRPHFRPALAGLLWGEKPEANALMSLRQALAALRRRFAPHLIITRQTVAFNREAPYWLDVEEFERLIDPRGTRRPDWRAIQWGWDPQDEGPQLPPARLSALRQAVELYRGDFLEGFHVREAPAFEEWLVIERERLQSYARLALHALAAHHTSQGEYAAALHYTTRLLALDPWREEVHRQRMWLLAHTGQLSAALAQYETCRRILAKDLGVEPSAETVALYERIRTARSVRFDNLPPQPTPFVGRQREMAELQRLLADPACRLLTLVGPGGIGKTRLALQIAARNRRRFLHGICFVPLASVPSDTFLVSAIAEALGFSFRGPESPKAQLLNHLREKEVLLVLDGFEHLLDGAPLLAEILQAAPAVKLLVTSQAHLRLRWECLFEVEGMQVPERVEDPDLESYDAIRLFLQIARRLHPNFSLEGEREAVVTICRLVQGMPLGIEMAAAWVRELSCAAIAREIEHNLGALSTALQDVPPRHRSLRATFDHAWTLLSDEERRAFRRLSVFRGGFRREAAERVTGVPARLLTALERRSLLRRSVSGRYEMHALLRQFAEEKLQEAPDERDRLRDRHCTYYADLLYRAEARARMGRPEETLAQVRGEIENVRASWAWAVEQGRVDAIGKALSALCRLYEVRGLFREGEAMFREARKRLQAIGGPEAEGVVGRLLVREGFFARFLGDQERAWALTMAGLEIVRRRSDRMEIALAMNNLGILAGLRGDYEEARRFFSESLAHYRAAGARSQEAVVLNNLSITERQVGAYEAARRFGQESLEISRAIGARRAEARALQNLGLIAYCRKDYNEAKRLHRESLTILREEGDRWGEALALGNLGEAARHLGEHAEAKRCHEESLALRREIGDRGGIAIALSSLGSVALALDRPREAKQYFRQALQIALELSSLPLALDILVEFSEVLAREGEIEKALELLALPLAHPATEAWVRERADALFRELSSQLPPATVAALKERGRARSLEEVVRDLGGSG